MFRQVSLIFLLQFLLGALLAQCPPKHDKLIPDRHLSVNNGFGVSVALSENYLVVGDYLNDTVAHDGGAVFLYQKLAGEWQLLTTFLPSDPEEQAHFGYTLSLSENYLFVGARAKSHVYVFSKKGNWRGGTEDAMIVSPDASSTFGTVINIRSDEEKLLISDPRTREGIVYLYTKPSAGWEAFLAPPLALEPPEDNVSAQSQNFGEAIDYTDDLLVIGAPNYKTGVGCVYAYQDRSHGDWNNLQSPAHLRSPYPEGYGSGFGGRVQIVQGNIFVQSDWSYRHSVFQFKPRATWQDALADTVYYVTDSSATRQTDFMTSHDSTLMLIGAADDSQAYAYSLKLTPDNNLSSLPPIPLPQRTFYSTDAVSTSSEGAVAIGHWRSWVDRNQGGGVWIVPKEGHEWKFSQWQTVTYRYYTAAGDIFGYAMNQVGNHLLVGAPNDRRASDAAGSIQIYRKTSSGWQKNHELVADSALYNFGKAIQFQQDTLYVSTNRAILRYRKGTSGNDWIPLDPITLPGSFTVARTTDHLRIEGSLLVATGQAQSSVGGVRNGLFLFRRRQGTWSFHQFIATGSSSPLDRQFTPAIDIFNKTILSVGNEGIILEENEAGQWQVTATLRHNYPNYAFRFGHSVLLKEHTAFIGFSGYNSEEHTNSGAVYVFQRAESGWQDTSVHHIIEPLSPQLEERFGSSLALNGDTLVVGAPGIKLTSDVTDQFNIPQRPGSVYVFRALNSDWLQATELTRIQGSQKSEVDLYGSAVLINGDELLVSAPIDDNAHGKRSGTVYTGLVSIPLVRVDSSTTALCISDTLVLTTSISGGSWSGNGITDAISGSFSAALAGPGRHHVCYRAPDCAYLEFRTIEVVSSFTVSFQHPTNLTLCDHDSTMLSATSITDARYRWFYQPEDRQEPKVLGYETADIPAHHAGKYWATVRVGNCQQVSDTVSVGGAHPPILSLPDQQVTCAPFPKLRIENFHPHYLYQLYQVNEPGDLRLISNVEASESEIRQSGTYLVRTVAGECQWESDVFTVYNEIEGLTVYPEAASINVCTQNQRLEAPQRDDFQYVWYYYEPGSDQPLEVGQEYVLLTASTGDYQVVIEYAQCRWTSERKTIMFQQPLEVVEVANVFTPNGDGINDTFGVPLLGVATYQLSIYNRQGKLVHQSENPQDSWDGNNAPFGVYFWILNYRGVCDSTFYTKKGNVCLLKEAPD